MSYKASAVKMYNATNSKVRFYKKKDFLYILLKNSKAYYTVGVVVANSKFL
jgi:hypothetical protein